MNNNVTIVSVCVRCSKQQTNKPFIACDTCNKLIYCSEECKIADQPVHTLTCFANIQATKPQKISDGFYHQLMVKDDYLRHVQDTIPDLVPPGKILTFFFGMAFDNKATIEIMVVTKAATPQQLYRGMPETGCFLLGWEDEDETAQATNIDATTDKI